MPARKAETVNDVSLEVRDPRSIQSYSIQHRMHSASNGRAVGSINSCLVYL